MSVLVFALAGFSVFAETVLDQSQTNSDLAVPVYSGRSLCQTFTVAKSGRLTRVDLYLDDRIGFPQDQQSPARISIVGTGTSEIPDDGKTFWFSDFERLAKGWFTINLSGNFPSLVSGVIYGIKFECADEDISTAPNDVWRIHQNSAYERGRLWQRTSTTWERFKKGGITQTNADASFRIYITDAVDLATVVIVR
jgi:hypothetical protein